MKGDDRLPPFLTWIPAKLSWIGRWSACWCERKEASTIPHSDSREGADFDRARQEAWGLQSATYQPPSASISTIGRNMERSPAHANLTFYGKI